MFNLMNLILTPAVKIMMLLCMNPAREYYQREISRLCGVSVGITNQTMKKLVQLEFVTQRKRGRMYFYRVNLKNPVVSHFKILMNVDYIFPLIRELRNFSKRIILFGSCSEGMDVEESDIDLLILTTDKASVRKRITNFNRKSDRRISPIIVDVNELVELRRKDEAFYEKIKRGIVLWEGE